MGDMVSYFGLPLYGYQSSVMKFQLQPVLPFRLDLTVWVLRRLPINKMDLWDGQTYQRVLVVNNLPVQVSIEQAGSELLITAEGPGALSSNQPEISAIITRILGLDIDLTGFYNLARADNHLAPLIERFIGAKPPRFPSIFEGIVNGISCQQISLIVGVTLLNRLSARFGLAVGDQHAFPRPEDLADALLEDVKQLGYSGRKGQNIIMVARDIVSRQLDLDGLNDMSDEQAATTLCNIYGIGRWTAQYVELRSLGRLNVFPADDVGGQKKLEQWLGLPEQPDYEKVHQIIDKWAPYRGLLYFYLLLDSREKAGFI